MPEPELFLLFVRPLNGADERSMLAIPGGQLDRAALTEWIQRLGVQSEWRLVSG